MIHNDILRRLRYSLSMNDADMIAIFKLVNYDMDRGYLKMIMKKEEEEGFIRCRDSILALFLDGLIIKNRGAQEGREPVMLEPRQRISNNEILRKLKIALTFRDDDIISVIKLSGFNVSKGELSALFRKPDHRNYKPCGDQFLRNFLNGLAKQNRPQ